MYTAVTHRYEDLAAAQSFSSPANRWAEGNFILFSKQSLGWQQKHWALTTRAAELYSPELTLLPQKKSAKAIAKIIDPHILESTYY